MRTYLWVLVAMVSFAQPVHAQKTQSVVVRAKGQALVRKDLVTAEDEALWDARRNALQKAGPILVSSQTVAHSGGEVIDRIDSRTTGRILRWEVIPNSRREKAIGTGRLVEVQIEAEVDANAVGDSLPAVPCRLSLKTEGLGQKARASIETIASTCGWAITDEDPEAKLWVKAVQAGRLKMLGRQTPYGIGGAVACAESRLSISLELNDGLHPAWKSTAEGIGTSFNSDGEAEAAADASAVDSVGADLSAALKQAAIRAERARMDGVYLPIRLIGNHGAVQTWLDALQDVRGTVSVELAGSDAHSVTIRLRSLLPRKLLAARLAELEASGRVVTHVSSGSTSIDLRIGVVQKPVVLPKLNDPRIPSSRTAPPAAISYQRRK